jgi:hypothetical protein
MMSILLIATCLLGFLLLAGLIIGLVVIMQSGRHDVVSTARQDWLDSRKPNGD